MSTTNEVPFPPCPTCTCPTVPERTMLLVVERGKPDSLGRESFAGFWFEPGRVGETERRAEYPGGPSREHVRCGHRAQQFFAVVDEHVELAKKRGETAIVVRFGSER